MDKGDSGSNLWTRNLHEDSPSFPSTCGGGNHLRPVRPSSRLGSLRSHRSHGPYRLAHPHWGCVTIPVDIPDDSSLGMGGNGMDKGDFGSGLGSEMFMKIHRFSLSPAVESPKQVVFGGGFSKLVSLAKWVGQSRGAVESTHLNAPILEKLLVPANIFCRRAANNCGTSLGDRLVLRPLRNLPPGMGSPNQPLHTLMHSDSTKSSTSPENFALGKFREGAGRETPSERKHPPAPK